VSFVAAPREKQQYAFIFVAERTQSGPKEGKLMNIATCGHAVISPGLLRQLLNRVRRTNLLHRDAAIQVSRQSECGIFNPDRAERLLRSMTCVCPCTEA